MSREQITNAAFKAWQAENPYGQVPYLNWLCKQKLAGKFWSA